MILKLVFLFCALYTVSSKNVNFMKESQIEQKEERDLPWRQEAEEHLSWPEEFNIEAKKMYLSSGLVEYFKYWRLGFSGRNPHSRLDYNDGAVKKIIVLEDDSRFGILYETHPETTEEESNKMVCYKTTGTAENQIQPLGFLPDLYHFLKEGKDNIKGVDCVKFTDEEQSDTERVKQTIWAYFDNETSTQAWIPVRYEEQTYNTWHGYISEHKIWDYYNFENEAFFNDFQVESPEKCIPVENEEEDIKLVSKGVATLTSEDEDRFNHVFATYMKQFNKKYADDEELTMRRSIFHKKWSMIEERNRQNLGYKLAINKISDRTEAEMKKHNGERRPSLQTVGNIPFPYTQEKLKQLAETLPSEYDARLEGLVGPVQDQEDCKASYSFGATATVEGALARSNGKRLIKLANQALLDCSWGYGNKGCYEGSNENSFEWIMKHGLPTELDYGTYAGQNGYCNMENVTNTYKIRGFTKVTPLSIDALKIALVNHGPLAVTIDVTEDFTSYDQGIYYDTKCSSTDVSHSVLLVGYGEKDGEEFWIIKNVFGSNWGIGGYMHISVRDNNCGVATEPFYVLV